MKPSKRPPLIDPSWPPDKQMRARMLVAFTLAISCLLAFTSVLLVLSRSWALVGVTVGSLGCAASAPIILRRTGSVAKAATPLLLVSALSIYGVALTKDGLYIGTCTSAVMVAFLSFYLLGVRYGAVYFTVMVILAALAVVVHVTGNEFSVEIAQRVGDPLYYGGSLIFGLAITGALAYHFESVRQRALSSLGDALVTVEHNERQLSSLVESTDARICSFDRELRLQVVNRSFAEAAAAQRGHEPSLGHLLDQAVDAAQIERWRPSIEHALERVAPCVLEETDPGDEVAADSDDQGRAQGEHHRETAFYPIIEAGRAVGVVLFSQDITERKRAQSEVKRLNAELVELSRQAGMATVASEVLHTAGNILNSVNVSATVLDERLRGFRAHRFSEFVTLVESNADDLATWFHQDARGRNIREMLRAFAGHFAAQQRGMSEEVIALRDRMALLAQVIEAQSQARRVNLVEECSVAEIVDIALALDSPRWAQMGVDVQRSIPSLPALRVDKHKVLEILVSLIGNARHALRDSGRPAKRVCVRVERVGEDRVAIHVEDNGVGIAEEDLDRIFQRGFTTKEHCRGFGLHSSAHAAEQLRGRLSCHSDGPGQGAIFTFELPLKPSPPPTSEMEALGPEPAGDSVHTAANRWGETDQTGSS
ncbi:sensor histidine kinase [Haliangium sp.]|uniref:sensor histidine kinase n=1 Tax=Haliangium sp. TaxID=2663208 RepID=UPI003D0AB8F5